MVFKSQLVTMLTTFNILIKLMIATHILKLNILNIANFAYTTGLNYTSCFLWVLIKYFKISASDLAAYIKGKLYRFVFRLLKSIIQFVPEQINKYVF